jgi:hypothetical protein
MILKLKTRPARASPTQPQLIATSFIDARCFLQTNPAGACVVFFPGFSFDFHLEADPQSPHPKHNQTRQHNWFSKRGAKNLKRKYIGHLKVFKIRQGRTLWVFYQCG